MYNSRNDSRWLGPASSCRCGAADCMIRKSQREHAMAAFNIARFL